jgi:hypothetical protein
MDSTRLSAFKRGRIRGRKICGALVVAGLLATLGASATAVASSQPQPGNVTKWQQAMEKLRLPGKGCFAASYPKVKWLSTTCKATQNRPYEPAPAQPAQGSRPTVVGNGNDDSVGVSGHLSSVVGTFGTVSTRGETGQRNGTGPQVANTYSLEINAKPFMSPLCHVAGTPSACRGWQQFLYSATQNRVFIQYWLEQYNATCPLRWTSFSFPRSTRVYCFLNSTGAPLRGGVPAVEDLGNVTFTASATPGTDSVVMLNGVDGAARSVDSVLDLASRWKGAEFAVLGDCCGSQANFSPRTLLNVNTTAHSDTTMAPMCVPEGYSGETNNLHLSAAPVLSTARSPEIISTQTSALGTPGCATASGTADPHLITFRHFLYDFQAIGDFKLATTGPGFLVENRQIPDPPSWPNAAVNDAVAARIGKNDVAVCVAPAPAGKPAPRLFINHKPVSLALGGRRNLPGGGDVSLGTDELGRDIYLIRAANGDSLTAAIQPANPNYIDAAVGLGRWPQTVHGLYANAGTSPTALASPDGTVFHAPFAFDSFYQKYADSWRVPAKDSLLSDCGGKVAAGAPANVLYADDLNPNQAGAARTICVDEGVKVPALLDACTVDVAVLGKAAALIYQNLPTDITWGKITPPSFSSSK